MEIVYLCIGLAAGAAAGWLICAARARSHAAGELSELERRAGAADGAVAELRTQLDKSSAQAQAMQRELDDQRRQAIRAQTQLEEYIKSMQEQKALLEDARTRLLEAFKALSGDALKTNNQVFLDLARKSFEAVLADARGDIGKRQEAIDGIIKPLSGALEKYEQHVRAIEDNRLKAYASLEEQLKSLASTHQQLQKETGSLVNALRTPQVRGRWGEVTLHRVVELAGMSEHCDYTQQVSVETDSGRLRPDMVVHLPSNRDIVVDSKVSLDAYLRAASANSDEDRSDALKQHAQQIRTHMQQLSGKEYWKQFDTAPEFVVMFIPGESFFAAALDSDNALLEDGMRSRVVLATPTTLIALLQAVAVGWRQEAMAANAQAMSDLGKELYERIKVVSSYLVTLGRTLRQTVECYNKAVGSMEARVLPSVRKFQEMGVGGEAIEPIEPLDVTPRTLTADDLPQSQKEIE